MSFECPESFLRKFNEHCYYHTWTIPTFSTDKQYSIEFPDPRVDDIKWSASLKSNYSTLAFTIKLISKTPQSFLAKIGLHVKSPNGCKEDSKSFHFSPSESACAFQIYIKTPSSGQTFLLEVQLKNFLLGKVMDIPQCSQVISEEESILACMKVFQNLVDDSTHSDITLVSKEGKAIRAHKAILAARSPVFSAMFIHDMKEKRSSVIKIEEYDHETLKRFVTFIYTGILPAFSISSAKLLFTAAEKYDIPSLKSMTEGLLVTGIKKENAIELLFISELFNSKVLQKSVIKYLLDIKIKFANLFEDEQWKNLLSYYPTLKEKFEVASINNSKCGYSISE